MPQCTSMDSPGFLYIVCFIFIDPVNFFYFFPRKRETSFTIYLAECYPINASIKRLRRQSACSPSMIFTAVPPLLSIV